MKKYTLLIVLLLQMAFASAQSIAVSFTAQDQNGNYCQLEYVAITNVTQGWNMGLAYPDTTLVLNYTDGIAEMPVKEGFVYNRPNPFHGTTEAVLNLASGGMTHIQLVNMQGMVLAECDANLAQGESVVKVRLAEPQLALLCATTETGTHVIKLLNIGGGGRNHLEAGSAVKPESKSGLTRDVGGVFALGDEMQYIGMVQQNGVMLNSENTVTQAQYEDEVVTFVFDMLQKPIVTTSDVTDITTTKAVCGGDVLSEGDAVVTARGVCWATTPNPTVSDSHTIDSLGLGEFVSNMFGLTSGTTYYVRAYATSGAGTAYGETKTFTTLQAPEGAVNGLFSINRTEKVFFSQGNLQYQASSGTLRFAEHQWDTIGATNTHISSSYAGWIDLFGWGTGGNPAYNQSSDYNYSPFVDWGTNPISNGGNTPDQWRTLTKDEWAFLLFERSTASGINFRYAKLNGLAGIVLLPDDWQTSYFPFNDGANISLSDWTNEMESHGAVFLPTAGYRVLLTVIWEVGSKGFYWSSTPPVSCYNEGDNYYNAYATDVVFSNEAFSQTCNFNCNERRDGHSVRLVSTSSVQYEDRLPVVVTTNETVATDCRRIRMVGNLIDEGDSEVIECGFCLSASDPYCTLTNTSSGNHFATSGFAGGTGPFVGGVTGYVPYSHTNYSVYVRAYATNSVGTAYGNAVLVNVPDTPCAPTVTTYQTPDSLVTTTTAVCRGFVYSDLEVTERGICYSNTNAQPTIGSSHIVSDGDVGSFACSLSGLLSGTTYYYRAYAVNSEGVGYGDVMQFTTLPFCTLPTVVTLSASDVTSSSAFCCGNVTSGGGGGCSVYERGVCYSNTNSMPTISDSHVSSGSGTGSFVVSVTGLAPNTIYYYCAYATNSIGTGYGQVYTFVTTSSGSVPTVTTTYATGVTSSSAVSGGNVTADGGSSVYERGVCYSNSTSLPTVSGSHVTSGSGTGSFTTTITSLAANTTYYYRAYATNSTGTGYGQVYSFTTTGSGAVPTVTTTTAYSITSSSAISGGNVTSQGSSAVTGRGVCYSNTNSQPTIYNGSVSSGSGTGSFTATLTGLASNTTYYYRAYATNSVGTGYGQVLTLTTSGGGTPSDPNLLSGQFSVSATRKVYFSKGNLQYNAASNTWRYAPNQYDVIGSDNSNISSTYSGYIDLFGWGTSGYNGCMPYQTSLSLVYGGNLSSIANSNYDWGVYNMSNMRTLTADEWNYVLSERNNALALKAPATVNGVHGWILLPDSWSSSPYTFVSYEDGARSYSSNVYTSTQWSSMQSAGAVFLPAGGWRYSSGNVSMTTYVGTWGYYWSTTSENAVTFAGNYCYSGQDTDTYTGCSVRLVRTVQ